MIVSSFFAVLLLCLYGAGPMDAAKILAIFPVQSPSHYILVTPLLKELAARGHEITAITPYPQKNPVKNIREIEVLRDFKFFLEMARDNQAMRDLSFEKLFDSMYMMGTGMAKSILEQQEIKSLMAAHNESFDLMIADICIDEALFGLGAHFKAALIGVAPFEAHVWNTDLTGAPTLPSFMPHALLSYSERMSFFERVHNLYAYVFDYFYYNFKYLSALEKIYEQYFGHTGVSLAEVRRNFSLVLLNQHSSLGVVRPYLPNMIEVGGMQVNPQSKPLPAAMQKFLDGAGSEGAIYFSLGSNIRSENIPPAKLSGILNTFRSLSQRVLWKFDAVNVPNLPPNVYISAWFPQSDVLAHPNIRLFITHGGLLSTTEAVVRGKPLLGIPMFGDQQMNMKRAEEMGFARTLDYNDISEATLGQAIHEVLSNARYAEQAATLSRRYHDKPQTALQTAAFWVEYVLRHRGAHHLHCVGLDLNFWQYYSLDVLALFSGALISMLMLAVVALHALAKFIKSPRGPEAKSVTSKNQINFDSKKFK